MNEKLTIKQIDEILSLCTSRDFETKAALFKDDQRKSVTKLLQKHEKRILKDIEQINEYIARRKYEDALVKSGVNTIVGIDEVGRGPLAGNVYCAAVVLNNDIIIPGIKDSKKLSHDKRQFLSLEIKKNAIDWCIGIGTVEEIDSLNILNATKLAMMRAVRGLHVKPEHVLIDALTLEGLECPQTAIIGGDDISVSIGAASIIAKVARDTYMEKQSMLYPEYNFKSNKGYGTQDHIKAIKEFGPCPIHRRSFIKNFV